VARWVFCAGGRTLFVNVQHPAEDTPNANVAANAGDFSSYWPLGERAPNSEARADAPRPLSATVVITKNAACWAAGLTL
jgi:uncharacterized protein